MFELIAGKSPYHSPTDMGVNMAGNCIIDDEVCQEASRKEIIRRYFKCLCDQKTGGIVKDDRYKLELLLNQAGVSVGMRAVEQQAHACSDKTGGRPAAAIELPDGTIVTGKTGPLLGAAASALLNALKRLAGIDQELDLVSAHAIEPIQTLKTQYLGSRNPRLHTDEILIALSSSVTENAAAAAAQGVRRAQHHRIADGLHVLFQFPSAFGSFCIRADLVVIQQIVSPHTFRGQVWHAHVGTG